MSVRAAARPERHRVADGWQGATIKSILDNPRYTGYAIFGRCARQEMLLDPDDVAAGHVTRFRRAAPDTIVRSREPAHPAIVSVEEFTRAQLLRRSKTAGGLATARKSVRGGRCTAREYLLRGMVRCGVCGRRMQGATIRQGAYYRCTTRTMAPGAAAVADHPLTVNLREDHVVEVINGWIGGLFAPQHRDQTVAALVGDQPGEAAPDPVVLEQATARRADAEARLRRYQEAIGAGMEPAALVEAINLAQAERAAAQAEITTASNGDALDVAEVYAMLDSFGDVGATLKDAKPAGLARLYRELDLAVRYVPDERTVYMTARPRVDSAGVRGGIRTRIGGIPAPGRGSCDGR